MKKVNDFIDKLITNKLSEEEIRTILLSLSNKEFMLLISYRLDKIDKSIISNMIEKNIPIISEIIEDLSTEEKLLCLKVVSKEFTLIESMLFKTLPINTVEDLFLSNPKKYKEEIESYILTPRQDQAKDKLIAKILSSKELSSYFKNNTLSDFKQYISDYIIILDDDYNIPNITFEEICNEIARYLANIEYRKSSSINKGIHNKISSKDLYQIFLEVNKGLKNLDSKELTEEDIVRDLELPLSKAVLFLDCCLSLTEEEIISILIKYFPKEKDIIQNKSITQLVEMIDYYEVPQIDIDNYDN